MTRCAVPRCGEVGHHVFPKDIKINRLWLKAIRRPKFKPTKYSRLCRTHFTENDYASFSRYTGMVYEHKYLKKDAVPSVFHWNKKESTKQAKARSLRLQTRNARKSLFEDQPSTSSNEDLLSIQDEYLEVESHDSDESAEVVEEEVAVPKLNRIVTKISNILLKLNRNIAGKQSNS